MNKFQKLHITIDSIHELNHFVYTHSKKNKLIGKKYTAPHFHSPEEHAEKDPWLYKINKHGYRGNDWSFNKQVIGFFGCSFTFGIGVEKNITDSVQEKISTNCINLGIPGASPILILKTFISFIKLWPVNFAIITLPPISRLYRPVYDQKLLSWNYESFLPHWISPNNADMHTAAYKFFIEDVNAAYLYDYIQAAELSAICTGTKILWSSWDNETENFLHDVVDSEKLVKVGDLSLDKARDNMHPGPMVVENWASNLSRKIKKHF